MAGTSGTVVSALVAATLSAACGGQVASHRGDEQAGGADGQTVDASADRGGLPFSDDVSEDAVVQALCSQALATCGFPEASCLQQMSSWADLSRGSGCLEPFVDLLHCTVEDGFTCDSTEESFGFPLSCGPLLDSLTFCTSGDPPGTCDEYGGGGNDTLICGIDCRSTYAMECIRTGSVELMTCECIYGPREGERFEAEDDICSNLVAEAFAHCQLPT